MVSCKQVTTELRKDVYDFSSLQQRKVRYYPNCRNQHMTSQLSTHYRSNTRSRTIGRHTRFVPFVQLKGRLLIRLLLSRLPLEIYHDLIGSFLIAYLCCKDSLILHLGRTPGRDATRQQRKKRGRSVKKRCLLWNARPVNRIADFADKLDITMNQGRAINSKPVR